MFAVATANSTVFIEFYLYLHDLSVSCVCFVVCFYVYMGQVPEIKLMMMMILHRIKCNNIQLVSNFPGYVKTDAW